MKRRGYTLVELLVVIAVIAILAAMLAPVILQAKESSRMRVCLSNMRQLGSAITSYIDDNSGYGLPQTAFKNPWALCVEPLFPTYLPGSKGMLRKEMSLASPAPPPQPKRIWICPGDVRRGPASEEQPFWWNLGSSYMYPGPTAYVSSTTYDDDIENGRVPDPLTRQGLFPRKPFMWRNHKRDILLADYWFDFHSGQSVKHDFGKNGITTAIPSGVASIRNVRCINIIFLDMHARAATPDERAEYKENTVKNDNPFYVDKSL